MQNGNIVDLTLPIQKASQNKKINEHLRSADIKVLEKLKQKIQFAYCKAPHFKEVFPLICQLIDYPETNLAKYLTNSLRELSAYLGLKTKFIYSSELSAHDDWDNAEQRIIDISKQLGGTEYYNLPGGRAMYNEQLFLEQNVKLGFITPELKEYKQHHTDKFIPGLSVIDFIMLGELSKK